MSKRRDCATSVPHTRGWDAERATRRLAARRRVSFGWLQALAPLVARFERRAGPGWKRFARVPPDALRPPEPPPVPAETGDVASWGMGEPVPGDVLERLRAVLGRGVGELRVHADEDADALAHEHAADAVTIGRDVFFRAGRYRPHEPEGLSLLAHEGLHVQEAGAGGVSERRSTAAGAAREEREARRVEDGVLSPWRAAAPVLPPLRLIAPRQGPVAPAGVAGVGEARRPASASATPVLRPMRAAADRDEQQPEAAAAASAPGMEEIRRTIYRDLLTQIRAEFERGG